MEQLVTSTPVKRGENLTDEQRQFLLLKIEQYKDSLTDKHNDLRTIHRKKEAWERITHNFNSCFANSTRKRTTQQIQTWYKNEKARRRRLLLRHHQRKDHGGSDFTGIEIKTDPHSPMEEADESGESREVIPTYLPPTAAAAASLLDGMGAKPTSESPSLLSEPPPIRPVPFPVPFMALSSKASASFPTVRLPPVPPERPDSAHLAAACPSFSAGPPAQTPIESSSPAALTDDGQYQADFPPTAWPDVQPSSGAPSVSRDEEPSFQQRLFEREMAVLEAKEECIRRYYRQKEAVLAVKERFYRLQIQRLGGEPEVAEDDAKSKQ